MGRSDTGGFIDGRQSEWANLIKDKDYGKPLKDCTEKRYIHVGPHRTGATFLQWKVFPLYKESEYVFSNDVILGRLFDNGLNNIEGVHSLCPDAKIIIVLRNQLSIINSAYRTYLKIGGVWSFSRYAEEIIKYRKYDYEMILKKLFRLFGKENCLVLFFENLNTDPIGFINDILSFIEIFSPKEHDLRKVKSGPSKYYNEYLRIVNTIVTRCFGFKARVKNQQDTFAYKLRLFLLLNGNGLDEILIKRFLPKKMYMKQFGYEKIRDVIINAYSKSNRKVEKMLNMDLKQYGYF